MKLNSNELQRFEELPQGWAVSTLGEVLPLTYGKALKKEARDESGNVPVYGSSGQVGVHSDAFTKKPALIVGRKGSVGEVYRSPVPCWPIDTVYFTEERDEGDLKYFEYLLKGLKLSKLDKSTAVPGLSRDDYNAVEVAIAPLDQQKRIVAEIEKQFSRLDEAVANLKRVKANLKRYKAAVLKAAVEGRLVETEAKLARREGRGYETGAQLLQRILEARRSQWKGKGKYKEPAAPGTTDLPELPEGWVWATLGQLVWSVKDGPHFSPKYSEEGIPFISGGNIRPEGIDFSSTKFISPELHEEFSKRCKPEYGDLLYTKGGTTGIARVNTETREFNVWVHVAVLKLLDSIEPFYLQHALNSQHCYRQAQEYTHGVGNQDLGLTRMVWITVPLPSTPEQKRIVAEVDRRLSLLRETEAQVDANLQRAERLRQSILQKAFSGHLISDDSNLEPVSVLLARNRVGEELKQTTGSPKASKAKPISKEATVADLIDALKSAEGWISAQDAFRRCGAGDGTDTDTIERLYAELRANVGPGIIEVERRGEEDWLRVLSVKRG